MMLSMLLIPCRNVWTVVYESVDITEGMSREYPKSSALRPSGAKGSLGNGGSMWGGELGRSHLTVWKTTTNPRSSSNQTWPSAIAMVCGCACWKDTTGFHGTCVKCTPSGENAQPICSWILFGLGPWLVPWEEPVAKTWNSPLCVDVGWWYW